MKKAATRLIIALWLMAVILSPVSALFADTKETEEKSPAPAELHQMTNEALIKQAEALLNEASDKFLAQLRNVTKSEIFLDQARQKTRTSEMPGEKPPVSDDTTPAEAVTIRVEHAKKRLDAFNRGTELIQAEKKLLDKYIEKIETAKTEARSFADTIGKADLFSLEITLRANDGSMSHDMIPESFNEQILETLKQKLSVRQEELDQKSDAARKTLEQIVLRTKDAKNAVTEAEAVHASAKNEKNRESKRQTLEQEYLEETPERLLAQISELREEQLWLDSALNLSVRRFDKHQENVDQIQDELERMPQPDASKLMEIGPEKAQKAGELVEKITVYHGKRIEKLKILNIALISLIKQGESLTGDAAVLGEHLFKMQIVAKVLEDFAGQGKIAEGAIPAGSHLQALTDEGRKLAKINSDILAAVEKAGDELTRTGADTEKSEKSREDVKVRLTNLKKAYEAAGQARKWEAELKYLTSEELVRSFQQNKENLEKNLNALQTHRKKFEETDKSVGEATQHFESLKGPLLRLALEESSEEKQNIVKRLYGLAGLELPEEKTDAKTVSATVTEKKAGASPAPDKPAPDKPAPDKPAPDKKEQKTDTEPAEKDTATSEAVLYQNMLSTRLRIIKEQNELRVELLNISNNMSRQLEQAVTILTDTGRLAQQYHASAVELKKRVGRDQIKSSQIPDGIGKALDPGLIDQLKTETAKKMNYQIYVRQNIERLGNVDETLEKTRELLEEIHQMAGKRLDILEYLDKMERDFNAKQEDISETEKKTAEQAAIRYLKSDDTFVESLHTFVRSEEIKSLNMLLQTYYLGLTEAEGRQENLKTQSKFTERLIRLAEDEKSVIAKAIPLFQKQAETMENQKEEEWIKIRMQLMPDKAEEILSGFEAKTGRSVSLPAPISEKNRQSAIEKAAELLFDKHAETSAADKWLDFFQQRLSPDGIDSEIGSYNDRIGGLNSRNAAIQRQVQYIAGHSPEDLAKLSPDEKPETKIKKLLFLKGQIGVLRADRYELAQQAFNLILVKLAVILGVAIFFSWLISRVFARIKKVSEKKPDSERNENLPFLVLIRKISMAAIWCIAFITVLDIAGFNIGTFLAGLGIGGFAIAFAVKGMLADVFGGLTIMMLKPFKVGDMIDLKGSWCIVREIGIRYSTLEDFSYNYNHIVPNAILTESQIINISSHPGFTILTNVRLSTRNSAEKIKLALELIREIVNNHPGARFIWVKHDHFDDYSFVLGMHYDIYKFKERATVETDVNAEVVRRFKENNIEFTPIPMLPPETT